MFIGEKLAMLDNTNPGVPRLGVPPLPFSECLHGVLVGCGEAVGDSTVCVFYFDLVPHVDKGCPTSFPSGLSIGAGFNVTMPNQMAQV
jgi:hypothetical protein